jgi:hypothetical protein
MFNLFPKKKSVDEIVKDADVIPAWQWQPTQTPSMLQAQNEIIDELLKEVSQLRHLKEENVDLIEQLAKYRDGYQGSCYACEPVGELNQKQELRLTAYQKMVEGAYETIEKLKTELHEVRMENNSLKIFPIEDKGDVRLQKHPMYPLHWGGYTEETSWEAASADLALRVVKLEQKVEELKLINCQIHINKKS